MPHSQVHVAVGVIRGEDGKILVSQRAAQQHLGGLWEFPGGKVEPGESVTDALNRELEEELGIQVLKQSRLRRISHDYGDKSVLLDVWNVDRFSGQPHGREGQPLRWLAADELRFEDFPQANKAIIRAIRLPDYLAIIPAYTDPEHLPVCTAHLPGRSLVRLRHSGWPAQSAPATDTLHALQQMQHGIIVDLATAGDERGLTQTGVIGVHANRHVLAGLSRRPVPEHVLFGASCHDADELRQAANCGADYVLLSPVLPSLSHPQQAGMGWDMFSQLAQMADMAVYAMGGLQLTDFSKARHYGARGIAGIRLFSADA